MSARMLPNGNLLIPKRAETDGVIGDGMVQIEPGTEEFLRWLPFVEAAPDELTEGAMPELTKAGFDPDQPRAQGGEEAGQWSGGGGSNWATQFDKLSAADRMGVDEYQAGGAYQDINEGLRRGKEPSTYAKAVIASLDSAIAHSTAPSDTVVYRGLTGKVVSQLSAGASFVDKAYSSTSLKQQVVEDYGKGGAVLRIRVRKGQPALYRNTSDAMGDEQHEVILPRGSTFKITSETERNGTRYFDASYE